MTHSIYEINYANIITFDGGDYFTIKVDKITKKIYQIMYLGKSVEKEITEEVETVASKYTIGDIATGTPYNLGVFLSRVLKGNVNRKCSGWMKVWNSIILE